MYVILKKLIITKVIRNIRKKKQTILKCFFLNKKVPMTRKNAKRHIHKHGVTDVTVTVKLEKCCTLYENIKSLK